MTDEARAVAETAKAGQEIARIIPRTLDTIEKAGTFLVTNTVAAIVTNIVGMGADWSVEARRRNLGRLQENTARILDGVAKDRLSEPSLSVVKPLLEAAADEGRPELQALWAALLANAMIDGGNKVRRDYFEAVRQMEPVAALVLDIIFRLASQFNQPQPYDVAFWKMKNDFIDRERMQHSIPTDDLEIARTKLAILGCIHKIGSTMQNVTEPPGLTAFGRGLLAACKAP